LIADLTAGKVGAVSGEWWLGHWGPIMSSIEYDPTVEWRVTTVVPAEGATGHTVHGRVNISNFRAISASAPEGAEEAAIKLLNWFWELYFTIEPYVTMDDYYSGVAGVGAFIWNWWPFLIWNAYEQQMNFDMVNAAIAANNPDSLISVLQYDLYRSYQMLYNDAEYENFWTIYRAWGEYITRVSPEGGWGTNVQIKEAGTYVVSEFTGPPTPTHLARGGILFDMWREFYALYIMGNIPEDSWDTFVADWLSLGGEEWTKEINEQFERMQ